MKLDNNARSPQSQQANKLAQIMREKQLGLPLPSHPLPQLCPPILEKELAGLASTWPGVGRSVGPCQDPYPIPIIGLSVR